MSIAPSFNTLLRLYGIRTQKTQNIYITFVQRRSSTLSQDCTNVIQLSCVCSVWYKLWHHTLKCHYLLYESSALSPFDSVQNSINSQHLHSLFYLYLLSKVTSSTLYIQSHCCLLEMKKESANNLYVIVVGFGLKKSHQIITSAKGGNRSFWFVCLFVCPQDYYKIMIRFASHFYQRCVVGQGTTHFLAPAVTVGERRELWILPPFFFCLFFCL